MTSIQKASLSLLLLLALAAFRAAAEPPSKVVGTYQAGGGGEAKASAATPLAREEGPSARASLPAEAGAAPASPARAAGESALYREGGAGTSKSTPEPGTAGVAEQ